MKRNSLLIGTILGVLTAIVVVALVYLGERLAGLPFVPFDVFDWMARILPGALITFTIDVMVRIITSLNLGPTSATAKLGEMSIAIVQFLIAGGVFGFILAALGRRRPQRLIMVGLLGGLILLIPALWAEVSMGFPAAGPVASVLWLAVVFLGWGAVLGRLVYETALQVAPRPAPIPPSANPGLSRRQFLYLVGAGSVTVVVSALGLSILSNEGGSNEQPAQVNVEEMLGANNTSGPAASPPADVLAARIKPAPGTRPELTSNAKFYRIDINTMPPEVDGNTWRLELNGLVNKPLSLSLADLRARKSYSQVITLECISNNLGGDLTSTALWKGVRLKDLLAEAGVRTGAQEVYIEAVDGFYESVPIAEAMDDRTILAYEMNGEPLPVPHGFPLRIYIPNHFGMKQPKWIKRMEVIDQHRTGYWVDRGWSATAIPPTTSVIDAVAVDQIDPETKIVPVGGIAYAGARGISKVEVQVDDGPWQEAELREPPLSPLTWVQWRYSWPSKSGRHTIRVRAYDGTGVLQIAQPSDPHPDGATGIYSKTATVPNQSA